MPFREFVLRQLGIRRKTRSSSAHDDEASGDDGLFAGHARFRRRFDENRDFYAGLAEGQSPKVLWIGCCDSRVVPEIMLDAEPGEIFVLRNIGNVVPPAGTPASISVGAAIEYAVGVLGVEAVVICGHTRCGGVAALSSGQPIENAEHLAAWVDIARTGYRPGPRSADDEVRDNVVRQLGNLASYPAVRAATQERGLALHGFVYDVATGDMLSYDDGGARWGALSESRIKALLAEDTGARQSEDADD